jgi:ATP-dependent exoDNAse (exonuclease V) alpha subunit
LDQFNKLLLDIIRGDLHTLYAVNGVQLDNVADGHKEFSREFLQTVTLPGMPPSILQLKVGAPIMLLRNLRPLEGLCNGTRLVVKKIIKHIIHARILTGDCKGQDTLIPRIELHSLESDLPFILRRRQFPVRVCFAMTVNKSQGQSLTTVGVYLWTPAFSHGQLYVALSRVTDVRNLTVLLPENETKTVNIVYPEVLEHWT